MTALAADLDEYVATYNNDRAHTGRLTKGRVPADIVYGPTKPASRDEPDLPLHIGVSTA